MNTPLVMMSAGLAKRYGGVKPLAPVGLHGEAIIDLNASDAMAASFGEIILVLGPKTRDAITYHVRHCWPQWVTTLVVEQTEPLGTAHALLCAREAVGGRSFGVANADDVYGIPALSLLASHLNDAGGHALVSFALEETVLGEESVTRGICEVSEQSSLIALAERRQVSRASDGRFLSDDGKEPKELRPDLRVSVNLWGFAPDIWPALEASVTSVHPEVRPDGSMKGEPRSAEEVLLPEVVSDLVKGALPVDRQDVAVLDGPGRCIGVTHAEDLVIARGELASMVGMGLRGERLFDR